MPQLLVEEQGQPGKDGGRDGGREGWREGGREGGRRVDSRDMGGYVKSYTLNVPSSLSSMSTH